MPNEAILKELGSRIAVCRLNKNITQENLAKEAGVSLPTVQRIEKGNSTQLANLLRILRALRLSENLEALLPAPVISPLQKLEMEGKKRLRASASAKKENNKKKWTWGEGT